MKNTLQGFAPLITANRVIDSPSVFAPIRQFTPVSVQSKPLTSSVLLSTTNLFKPVAVTVAAPVATPVQTLVPVQAPAPVPTTVFQPIGKGTTTPFQNSPSINSNTMPSCTTEMDSVMCSAVQKAYSAAEQAATTPEPIPGYSNVAPTATAAPNPAPQTGKKDNLLLYAAGGLALYLLLKGGKKEKKQPSSLSGVPKSGKGRKIASLKF